MKLATALRGFCSTPDKVVLISNHNHVTKCKLNRPRGLNALNLEMIQKLSKYIKTWNDDEQCSAVLMVGAGGKAFCAGGDIRAIYDSREDEAFDSIKRRFFFEEYIVDYQIAKMKPVQIALYNGIVMGGGVGISINAPIRIATEASLWAMPETAIGLFPDVGGSFFLPKLDHGMGMYFGLTGSRLVGQDLVRANIATHFMTNEQAELFKVELFKTLGPQATKEQILDIVEAFSETVEEPLENIDLVQKHFDGINSVEEAFHNLESANAEWTNQKLNTMKKCSPLSLKVVYEQLTRGKGLSLEHALSMEYTMSQNFMQGQDFYEGVRASLVDKDKNPQWQHESIYKVTDDEVNQYFEPIENQEILDFQKFS